jgi:hypothetical protein
MSFFARNCRDVSRLILQREDRRLSLVERMAVRLHLRICLMCTRFTRQVALMNRAMGQWKRYAERDEADGPAGN